MKIIKAPKDKNWSWQVSCSRCEAVLEITQEDVNVCSMTGFGDNAVCVVIQLSACAAHKQFELMLSGFHLTPHI
jgi:hypothetical protein